jgi:DNA-binding NarL/FixJ family response regulator
VTSANVEAPAAEPARRPVRVAVVDDHPLFREGVQRILEGEGDVLLVGQAGGVDDAIALLETAAPDVLLLDLRLGAAHGLDLLARLPAGGAPRVVIVTAFPDDQVIADAMRAGARGVVLKDAAPETLLAAIRQVAAGALSIPPELATRLVGALAQDGATSGLSHLTSREREIAALVGRGLRNRDIAQRLGVAEKTVKGHLTSIFYKLGVADRLELALLAIKTRLAPSPGDGR